MMILHADLLEAMDPVALFRRAEGFEPHPWQVEYLHCTTPLALLKGRQCGASLAASLLAIHQCIYWPNSVAAILSPTLRQSQEIAVRARQAFLKLGVNLIQDSAQVLRIGNGSRVISLPGTPKSSRGYTAQLLVIDEAAFIDPATFISARAQVATGGRLVVQSTGAEPFGPFYDLFTANDQDWTTMTVRSDEVETISKEFLAQEKRTMSPGLYALEYEATFGLAGTSLFNADRLMGAVLPIQDPVWEKLA